MVKDKQNDKIFGDTRRVERDVRPTYGKTLSKDKKASLKSGTNKPKKRTIGKTRKVVVKPTKTRRSKDMKVIPDLGINYDATLPKDADNIDPSQINNLVNVPERLLLLMRSNAEARSQSYSKFLLTDVMPLVMALDAGNKFVQTALQDGVGLDIDIDSTIIDAVQNLIRMDTIVFYLKRLKLPQQYKRKFLDRLVEVVAEDCVTRMNQHKRVSSERFIKDLEGIVVRGRSKEVDEKIQRTMESRRDIQKAVERTPNKGPRVVQDSGIRAPGAARRRTE